MTVTLPVSYTSVDLIMDTLPEIGSLSDVTSAHIASVAGQVEGTINFRIAKYYSIPFTVAVPMLQDIATNLTIYRLLTRRIFTPKRVADSPWPDRYKEANDLLELIAGGGAVLLDSANNEIASRTDVAEVKSNTENYHSTFSELGRYDQTIDPDKLDDLSDERD